MNTPKSRIGSFRPFAFLAVLALSATSLRADVVFAWNELLLHLVESTKTEPLPPPLEARLFAITHLAMQDALVAASESVRSLPEPHLARQRSAIVSAAREVLRQFLPAHTQAIDALASRHFALIPDGAEKTHGIELGTAAARRLIARREDDGWVAASAFHSSARLDDYEHVAAELAQGRPPAPSPWLKVIPFGMKTAGQFSVSEVRTVTRSGESITNLTLQNSRLFQGLDASSALASSAVWRARSPIVVWNRIGRQLSAVEHIDLAGQARVLAALNVALADAILSGLHWRHTIGNWRVMFADGWIEGVALNPDSGLSLAPSEWQWTTVQLETRRILLPPVASYPSLDAVLAGAAQSALRTFFKTDEITFTLPTFAHGAQNVVPRSFTSISAAARECAFAASLQGPVTREACVAGYSLGALVGTFVSKRRLRD